MEYFTYEMDIFKFERISHYDLYFKPSVPPMPDFFPIRCGAHFFVGSFIRCLARAERLRLGGRFVDGRAGGGEEMRIFGVDGRLIRQLQRADKRGLELGEEVQRPT